MADRKVVVQDGNLYKVSDYKGIYYASKVGGGNLGQAKSLEDAIILIKSHSGKEIKKIDNW